MLGQVLNRPTGIMLGFEISQNPFIAGPSLSAIAHLPFAQKIAALRDPATSANADPERIRRTGRSASASPPGSASSSSAIRRTTSRRPSRASRRARSAMGVEPAALAYDLLMQDGGKKILYRPSATTRTAISTPCAR